MTADWITDGPVAFNEADLLRSGANDSFAHSILSVHELVGEVDVPRLSEAYRWIGQRHESFRTAFVHEAKGWRRRVHLVPRLALEHIDLSAGPDAEASARALLSERFVRPFDRAVAPLVRPTLLTLAPGRFWLVHHGDHVVMDGLSFAWGLGEILSAYQSLADGALPELPKARQAWQHVAALHETLAPLKGVEGPWSAPYPADGFRLKADPTRPGGEDAQGARQLGDLGDLAPLDTLCAQLGVSRSAPILAALALGLRALTRRPDVGFTLIRSGRRDPDSRGVIGCLAWGDAWDVVIPEGMPAAALLAEAHRFITDTAPWRMLRIPTVSPPTGRLVLNINRFDASLSLPGVLAFPRPDIVLPIKMWTTHDLLVQVFPMPGMTPLALRYRASMFESETMARLAQGMTESIAQMLNDPNAPAPSLDS